MIKRITSLLIAAFLASNTYAADNKKGTLDAKQIYFGAGLSLNDIGRGADDAVGFQIFAGIPIPVNLNNAKLKGEVGYMDSGDFDGPFGTNIGSANGLWANAVIDIPLQDNIGLVGRAGFDFGDDDGIMFGGGLGFQSGKNLEIRFEYVIRDEIDSLQANVVIRQ